MVAVDGLTGLSAIYPKQLRYFYRNSCIFQLSAPYFPVKIRLFFCQSLYHYEYNDMRDRQENDE
jgi:hypothetical protein